MRPGIAGSGAAGGALAAALAMAALVGTPRPVAGDPGTSAARRPGPSREESAVRSLIARQLDRFPAMEPQDVYKLLYQATLGSRHAGLDSAMAAGWLDRELREMGPGPDEAAIDTISADGRMVRVNLRPYLAAGGDRAALLRAFVRTAREFRGSSADLRRQLGYVERMASAGELQLPAGALRRYFARMQAAGYPAVDHSAAYLAVYRPAYRVVLGAMLP
jgi:hypothetical protein